MTSSPPCDSSSAMAPSRAWMATAAWSSAGGLVVMRCSHRPGRGESGQHGAAPFGGVADQLVAEAHDERQQRDARQELRAGSRRTG